VQHLELIIFRLLVAVAGLGAAARLLNVPYPILLVLGGLALGFAPGIPAVELPPELVLMLFLPPYCTWQLFSPRCGIYARTCDRSRCCRSAL